MQGLMMMTAGYFRQIYDLPKFFWRYPISYINYGAWALQVNSINILKYVNIRKENLKHMIKTTSNDNPSVVKRGLQKIVVCSNFATLYGVICTKQRIVEQHSNLLKLTYAITTI
jgi:hypothetical protein